VSNRTKPEESTEVARFAPTRLPWNDAIEARFGEIGGTKANWKVLCEAIFPAAQTVDAIVMALAYCATRKLDVFKRPVHIVPMWDRKANDGKGGYVETVWPSIAELRTTAFRTGQYSGCEATVFGPTKKMTFKDKVWEDDEETGKRRKAEIEREVEFPEWAQMTVVRVLNNVERRFAGPKVYWLETFATIGASDVPNKMWQKRPSGQLEKCAEAAALRKAFPEEIGNEYAAEEMEGREIYHNLRDVTPRNGNGDAPKKLSAPPPPPPAAGGVKPGVIQHQPATIVKGGKPVANADSDDDFTVFRKQLAEATTHTKIGELQQIYAGAIMAADPQVREDLIELIEARKKQVPNELEGEE